jgi:hypothetical protein
LWRIAELTGRIRLQTFADPKVGALRTARGERHVASAGAAPAANRRANPEPAKRAGATKSAAGNLLDWACIAHQRIEVRRALLLGLGAGRKGHRRQHKRCGGQSD